MRNPGLWFAMALAGSLAVACGGSGGGDGGGGGTVHGTAATGAPISSATVTLKDSVGTPVTGTTNVDGTFSLAVAGLVPPFLLEVDDGAGTVLYSVGSAAGVVNVTPFTDLIIKTYYEIQGLVLDASFFDAFSGTDPVPSPVEVRTIQEIVETMIALWLQTHGVDPATFDVITTPFAANGLGVDAVLDHSTVAGGSIAIDDGTTTQASTLTADTSGTVTVDTTTSSGGSTTTSTDTTEVPTSTQETTDLEAVAALIQEFVALVNARGAGLTAADLMPYFDPGYLDDGKDRTVDSAMMATFFRPNASNGIQIVRVLDMDEVNHLVTVCFEVAASAGGQTSREKVTMRFKGDGAGHFRFFGNQRLVDVWLRVEANTFLDGTGAHAYEGIAVDVTAPTGSVSDSVSIDGGPFVGYPLPKASGTRTDRFNPTPTTTLDYVQDAFYGHSEPPALVPPAGTLFQLHFTPTAGVPTTYDVVGNGVTDEHITITTPTGHALANANLGGTRPVAWTLPHTYLVTSLNLDGQVQDALGNTLELDAVEPVLGPTATAGTMQLPASWDDAGGHHVTTRAYITVWTTGPNGEFSHVTYEFKD